MLITIIAGVEKSSMATGSRRGRDWPAAGHVCANCGENTAAGAEYARSGRLQWSSPTGGGERGDEPSGFQSHRIGARRKVNNRYGLVSLGVTRPLPAPTEI